MKKITASVIMVFLFSGVNAQWECRSQLSSSLKPLGKSNIYWATELTASAGYLTNNAIFNSMGFLGVDISSQKSTLFIETGYKFWDRLDVSQNINFRNGHFGIRELFYQTKSKIGKMTIGIQSAGFDDYYLLNERIAGINFKNKWSKFSLNLNAGSVVKDFARNGIFCSVGYLYDIIPGREIGVLGNILGQTNFAGVSLKYSPSGIDNDEFSSESTNPLFSLESLGLLAYSEFGSWISDPLIMFGTFSQLSVKSSLIIKSELIYQSTQNNKALIYIAGIERSINNRIFRLNFNCRFFGFSAIDSNAKVLNSYSNIFAGEVLRLDSRDMPLLQIASKISFPTVKSHIKLQYSSQISGSNMREVDIEIGKRFNKHFQINAIGAYVKNNELVNNVSLARVECRISF